jgi:hypothetical protein
MFMVDFVDNYSFEVQNEMFTTIQVWIQKMKIQRFW